MIVACPRPQRLPEARSGARFETSPVLAHRVICVLALARDQMRMRAWGNGAASLWICKKRKEMACCRRVILRAARYLVPPTAVLQPAIHVSNPSNVARAASIACSVSRSSSDSVSSSSRNSPHIAPCRAPRPRKNLRPAPDLPPMRPSSARADLDSAQGRPLDHIEGAQQRAFARQRNWRRPKRKAEDRRLVNSKRLQVKLKPRRAGARVDIETNLENLGAQARDILEPPMEAIEAREQLPIVRSINHPGGRCAKPWVGMHSFVRRCGRGAQPRAHGHPDRSLAMAERIAPSKAASVMTGAPGRSCATHPRSRARVAPAPQRCARPDIVTL